MQVYDQLKTDIKRLDKKLDDVMEKVTNMQINLAGSLPGGDQRALVERVTRLSVEHDYFKDRVAEVLVDVANIKALRAAEAANNAAVGAERKIHLTLGAKAVMGLAALLMAGLGAWIKSWFK